MSFAFVAPAQQIEFLFVVKILLERTSGARDRATSVWARLVVLSGWVRE